MDYHVHAGMPESDYAAFISAVSAEFCDALRDACPEIVAQECFDPLIEAYGLDFNPVRLQDTSEARLVELQQAFAEHFECDIPLEQIREAVLASKARWPA